MCDIVGGPARRTSVASLCNEVAQLRSHGAISIYVGLAQAHPNTVYMCLPSSSPFLHCGGDVCDCDMYTYVINLTNLYSVHAVRKRVLISLVYYNVHVGAAQTSRCIRRG